MCERNNINKLVRATYEYMLLLLLFMHRSAPYTAPDYVNMIRTHTLSHWTIYSILAPYTTNLNCNLRHFKVFLPAVNVLLLRLFARRTVDVHSMLWVWMCEYECVFSCDVMWLFFFIYNDILQIYFVFHICTVNQIDRLLNALVWPHTQTPMHSYMLWIWYFWMGFWLLNVFMRAAGVCCAIYVVYFKNRIELQVSDGSV